MEISCFMKNAILVTLAVFLLTSCATAIRYIDLEDVYNEEWVGRSYSEIVKEFGAPDRVEADGLDGKILVYERFSTVTKTDVDTHFGRFDPDYTTTVTKNKLFKHFFIGSDNICYKGKSNEVEADPESKRRSNRVTWISTTVIGGVGLILAVLGLAG